MTHPKLEDPYYVHTDGLPGMDFNRELIEPGKHDAFPDGAVGIRVDDDFWAVAALPWSYKDTPLEEVVKTFWPHYFAEAEFCPDHGTVEQQIFNLQRWGQGLERTRQRAEKENRKLSRQLDRLRLTRSDLHPSAEGRVHAEQTYFIRQYERLLIATAHEHEGQGGVCTKCGLYASDHVHMAYWREKHDAGFPPNNMKSLSQYRYEEGLVPLYDEDEEDADD